MKWYEAGAIFLIILLVYSLTTVPSTSGDTKPAALLPYTILKYHTVYFDNVYPGYIQNDTFTKGFINVSGHWVSAYPVVLPVLLTPLYYLYFLLGHTSLNIPLIAKWFAGLLCAVAGTLFYCLSKRLFPKRIAIITTIVFAFGTLTWCISSQQLWMHGLSELLIVSGLLVVIRNEGEPGWKNFVLLGVILGLFVMNRPSDIPLLIPFCLYVLINRQYISHFILSAVLAAFPFIFYNLYIFGNPFGFYNRFFMAAFPVITESDTSWTLQSISGFAGQWVSPNRGLLVFCPVLLFAFYGALVVYRDRNRFLLWFIPAIVLLTAVYSLFRWWDGGGSAGPRYLTAALPVLAVYVGYALQKMKGKWWVLFALLLGISIFIEAVSAWGFAYSTWSQVGDMGMWSTDSLILNSYQQLVTKADALWLMPLPDWVIKIV